MSNTRSALSGFRPSLLALLVVVGGCDDASDGAGGSGAASTTKATSVASTSQVSTADSSSAGGNCPDVAGAYTLTETPGNPMDCADSPPLTVTQNGCTLLFTSVFGSAEGPIDASGQGEAHSTTPTKSDATYTFTVGTPTTVKVTLTSDPQILDVTCTYDGTHD